MAKSLKRNLAMMVKMRDKIMKITRKRYSLEKNLLKKSSLLEL